MSPKDSGTTIIDQGTFIVPELSIKQLLDVIPYVYTSFRNLSTTYIVNNSPHCFKRSALRSSVYM